LRVTRSVLPGTHGVTPSVHGVTPSVHDGLDVAFTIRNVGTVRGDEVPQVYLGAPDRGDAGAQFAARSLVAFDRVALAPGQSRRVLLHIPLRRLQYWSQAAHRWQLADAARAIEVGASSRDIRLSAPMPRLSAAGPAGAGPSGTGQ